MERPSLTLEQLRIFVGVAEREHMTRAAEVLNITQSAVSAAISGVEERHGVKLFHRVGRGICLTEAGQALLVEARALLAGAHQAEQLLAEFGGMKRGTLKLVASQTIASYWLPPFLAAFRERHPAIGITLDIDNTEGAVRQILRGSAELGFAEGAVDEPAVASWEVARDQLLLVSATPVPSPDRAWIESARWIVRERGSGTRSTFAAMLADRGIDADDLDAFLILPSNEAIRTAVEAGAGVAVLPESVAGPSLKSGRLHLVDLTLPARAYFGLRHKEHYRSSVADALLELIAEMRTRHSLD